MNLPVHGVLDEPAPPSRQEGEVSAKLQPGGVFGDGCASDVIVDGDAERQARRQVDAMLRRVDVFDGDGDGQVEQAAGMSTGVETIWPGAAGPTGTMRSVVASHQSP